MSPSEDLALLMDAIRYAAEQHREQRRKGDGVGPSDMKTPYVNHPITCAQELATTGGVTDIAVLAAAILHDTIEDTPATEADLRARFGDRITGIVLEVTDDKALPKQRRKDLQIEHAPHLSPEARLVKLADKLSNVRDLASEPPRDWPLQRKRDYFDWAKAVVDGLRGANGPLEAAFDQAYSKRP